MGLMKQKEMEKIVALHFFPPNILKPIVNTMYFLLTENYSFWDPSCQSQFLFSRVGTMQLVL